MEPWTEGDIPTNGITTHYYRTGGDKPALVLAHGLTDSGLCWTRIARAFEHDYDVVMFDARGHGRSEAPPTGYTVENRAVDMAQAIRQLRLERPAVMGHSMGADVAAALAASAPELVRCLVLEDPPWGAQDPGATAEQRSAMVAQWTAGLREHQAHSRAALIAERRTAVPVWDEAELAPWADAKLQAHEAIFSWLAEPRQPWQRIAPQITCPTLLVTAEPARGAIVTPETAQAFQQLCLNGEVVFIAGAGHNIRREQYEPFMHAARVFLRDA